MQCEDLAWDLHRDFFYYEKTVEKKSGKTKLGLDNITLLVLISINFAGWDDIVALGFCFVCF